MHLALAAISIFVAECLTACGGGAPVAEKPVCTVEIDGDSIMSQGIHPMAGAQRLATVHPDWQVDDRAVRGLHLKSLVDGYAEAFPGAGAPPMGPQPPFEQVAHPSRYIVIELGGNDAYSNLPVEQFEAQLVALVGYVWSVGKVPVFTGIPQMEAWGVFDAATLARIDHLNVITHNVAERLAVAHAGWDSWPAKTTDGIHPTTDQLWFLVDRLALVLNGLSGCR